MNQLADALESAGYTPGDVTKMRSSLDALKRFKRVLVGMSKIVRLWHDIDCDADPYLPDGFSVDEHHRGGRFEWNLDEITIHQSLTNQQDHLQYIKGGDFLRELANEPICNANVLDYLLAHPELIPDDWKGKNVYFWGTIYLGSDHRLSVRCLEWNVDKWGWKSRRFENDFCAFDYAAVFCKK